MGICCINTGSSELCDDPMGWGDVMGVGGRFKRKVCVYICKHTYQICVHMTDSCCCTAKTNTTL